MTKVAPLERPLSRTRGRPPSGKSSQTSSVQSLDRALRLLELLADQEGLTLTDAAQMSGMAPSTAHRLLSTLQGHQFIDLDEETGRWHIGVKAFQVGNAFIRSRKLVNVGRTVMRELMEECGETVNLGIEDDGAVVFISQYESHAPMRAFFRPGHRGPIHASGIGKALMSTWPEEDIRAAIDRKGLDQFTEKTVKNFKALLAELETIRQRGWSIDDQEHTLGMRCVAAPVFNEFGEAIAGISMSGPSARIPDEKIEAFGPKIRAAADLITASIGGVKPA